MTDIWKTSTAIDWGNLDDGLTDFGGLMQVEVEDDFSNCRWYDQHATRAKADQMLRFAKPKSFLVRPSSSPGMHALSMKSEEGAIIHAVIQVDSAGLYFLQGAPDHYGTITALVGSLDLTPVTSHYASTAAAASQTMAILSPRAAESNSSVLARPSVQMSGWLKLSGTPHWFVLEEDCLSWFKDEITLQRLHEAQTLKTGTMNLKGGHTVLNSTDRGNELVISHPDSREVLTLGVSNTGEARAWLYLLGKACGEPAAKSFSPASHAGPAAPFPARKSPAMRRVSRKMRRASTEVKATKQGTINVKGKSKWAAVQSGYLIWFSSNKESEAEGALSLLGASVKRNGDTGFDVMDSNGAVHEFSTKMAADADAWAQRLGQSVFEAEARSLGDFIDSSGGSNKSGWLGKKGKKRYVKIMDNVLMWFTSEEAALSINAAAECQGSMPLAHGFACCLSAVMPDAGKVSVRKGIGIGGSNVRPAHSVLICTPLGRAYTFTADNADEANKWYISIEEAISVANAVAHNAEKHLARHNVGFSGWLELQSKKRFAVVRGDLLFFYDTEEEADGTAVKDHIALSGCSVARSGATQLTVHAADGQHYQLGFSDAADKNVWSKAIDAAILRAHRAARAQTSQKRTGFLQHNRTRRFVELRNETLTWSTAEKNESARKLKGALEVAGCTLEALKDTTFAVVAPSGVRHEFVASDASDARAWHKALTEILKDTSFSMSEQYVLSKNHKDELLQLYQADDFGLIRTLLGAYGSDEVVRSAFMMIYSQKSHLNYLDSLIRSELDESISVGTLFRGNSVATKSTREFLSVTCGEFMTQVMGVQIRAIMADLKGYEVDPSKLPAGQNRDENIKHLQSVTQRVFRAIQKGIELLPAEVFHFFANTSKCVNAVFPGQYTKAASGFLFLRFLCPAIFSPVFFNLSQSTPDPPTQRKLVLVAKILQNLANDVEFGKKEEFLVPFNAFIATNRADMTALFNKLAAAPASAAKPLHEGKISEEDTLRFVTVVSKSGWDNFKLAMTKLQKDANREGYMQILGSLLRFGEIGGKSENV